jgi:hypothetical protein
MTSGMLQKCREDTGTMGYGYKYFSPPTPSYITIVSYLYYVIYISMACVSQKAKLYIGKLCIKAKKWNESVTVAKGMTSRRRGLPVTSSVTKLR